MDEKLSDEMWDRIGRAIADVLDERADARALIDVATALLVDGHDVDEVVELATSSAHAVMSDVRDSFFRMVDAVGMPRYPAHPRVLLHLVDHDEIDLLLAVVDIDRAAAAWLRDCRSRSRGAEPGLDCVRQSDDWWAVSLLSMNDAWIADRVRMRATLDSLIAQASTDWELACIGAGPLENFVNGAADDLDWLEGRLRTTPKYRDALAGARIHGQVTPANFERLERAVGRRLVNPDRSD